MVKNYSGPVVLIFFLFSLPLHTLSQDLANIGKQKPLDLSGSLSLRLNSFTTTTPNSTRDPFFWTISGNPTLSVYGITLPFSVVLSDKQKDFRQPFNMFGVSPYYKKIRFHAGYRSVYFSDYTLSDHIFLGGGIEAEPSIFRLGFVYGRFMKAIEPVTDTIAGQYSAPSFARRGFAAKFGMGTYNNYVDLILLNIRDDTTSAGTNPGRIGIPGAENLAVGIKTHQQIAKIFSLDADFGLSAYTMDLRSPDLDIAEYNAVGFLKKLYTPRQTSEFRLAGKASLGMHLKKFSLKLNYRRVEPDYQSMGAYYLNTDIENLTLAPSWQMFKGRVRITGSIGIQRNNLFSDKLNNSLRRANSLSLAFTPNSKWGINVNYSNYNMSQTRNYTLIRDTLMMEQFSNNVSGNLFFNFGTKTRRQNLTVSAGYMDLADNSMRGPVSNTTTSVNPSVSYRFTNTDSKFSFNVNANASSFNTDISNTLRLGLSAGLSKSFAKDKFKLGTNASFFSTQLNGANYSNTLSVGGNFMYQPVKGHSFNLGINLVNRSFTDGTRPGSSDLLGFFGYTFNF
jgi:hypothetical protein